MLLIIFNLLNIYNNLKNIQVIYLMSFCHKIFQEKKSDIKNLINNMNDDFIKNVLLYGLKCAEDETDNYYDKYVDHKIINVGDMMVDEKIAPLVLLLCKMGMPVINSCEDDIPANYVWIELKNIDDITRIINILFVNRTKVDTLYKKYKYWKINTNMYNLSSDNQLKLKLSLNWKFPKSDYDEIYRRISEHYIIYSELVKNVKKIELCKK